ncbi:hypothetical protein NMY22_g3613 [Coprinellus aureogranulatus]|nr:hypothetical protein NMY22_g3613 [Coprinellus aureogranulatus]
MDSPTLNPFGSEYLFPDLDTLYCEIWSNPHDEDKCYHLWAQGIELLNAVAFQHAQGRKRFTHAPQRAFRKAFAKPSRQSRRGPAPDQPETPSEQSFFAGVAEGLTSSPPRPRTRSEHPELVAGPYCPVPPTEAMIAAPDPPEITRGSTKRTVDEVDNDPVVPETEEDQEYTEEPSLSSRETSFGSNFTEALLDADPTARRIPDSTIFAHTRGPNKPFYPVIIVENKPFPTIVADRLARFTASSVQICREHWDFEPVKTSVAWAITSTRYQAREQLEAVFEETDVDQVLYIYAMGAFYAAFVVTREDFEAGRIPPSGVLRHDSPELQYLFARPDGTGPTDASNTNPNRDQFINWRLNAHLIELWKTVAEWEA